jgi:hypothetical protein
MISGQVPHRRSGASTSPVTTVQPAATTSFARFLWIFTTLGLVVVIVVIGFLIGIVRALDSIDGGLSTASGSVAGAAGNLQFLGGPAPVAGAAAETFLVLGVQGHGSDQFVTLRCDPPSGTHPLPEAACRVLGEAGGDFTKISGQPGTMCPDIYEPVTAVASGDFQGRAVSFQRTYPNRCDLARHTAPVFAL